jgi:hypothetical protein
LYLMVFTQDFKPSKDRMSSATTIRSIAISIWCKKN